MENLSEDTVLDLTILSQSNSYTEASRKHLKRREMAVDRFLKIIGYKRSLLAKMMRQKTLLSKEAIAVHLLDNSLAKNIEEGLMKVDQLVSKKEFIPYKFEETHYNLSYVFKKYKNGVNVKYSLEYIEPERDPLTLISGEY